MSDPPLHVFSRNVIISFFYMIPEVSLSRPLDRWYVETHSTYRCYQYENEAQRVQMVSGIEAVPDFNTTILFPKLNITASRLGLWFGGALHPPSSTLRPMARRLRLDPACWRASTAIAPFEISKRNSSAWRGSAKESRHEQSLRCYR